MPDDMTAQQIRLTGAVMAMACVGYAADDVERVFRLRYTQTPLEVQEMTTVIRSLAEIRQAYADASSRTFTVKAPQEQVAFAEWLVAELDRPAEASGARSSGTYEFPLSSGASHLSRVFYLPSTLEPQQVQEFATVIRSVGEIRHAFVYNSTKAVALRGTAEQIALAEWLIGEIMKPDQSSTPREFRLEGRGEDVVQVFHLPQKYGIAQLQEITHGVRATTQTRRMFTYNDTRAIAARGTAEQIASVERLLKTHLN